MNKQSRNRSKFSLFTLFTALLGFVALAAFPACNTAEGIGEDMEDAGEELQEEVD